MKIVLDTNILVSGLLQSLGNPAKILTLVLSGAIQICYDHRILDEYSEVLARPRFKFAPERIRDLLKKIEQDGVSIEASENNMDLPDPDDEPFLAVALAASVDFLITGNLAHYPPSKRRGCPVVSPAAFMEHWRKLQQED